MHHVCTSFIINAYWSCPSHGLALYVQYLEIVPMLSADPKAWFEFMDADQSGFLSYEEIVEGLKSQMHLDWHRIEADVDRLFQQWDSNRDGKISYAEFSHPQTGVIKYLASNYSARPRPPPPDIRRYKEAWFDYWDEDRSGHLDKDEVSRALVKTFRLYHVDRSAVLSTLEVIWPIFDIDGSGQIDRQEFLAPDNLAETIIAQLAIT